MRKRIFTTFLIYIVGVCYICPLHAEDSCKDETEEELCTCLGWGFDKGGCSECQAGEYNDGKTLEAYTITQCKPCENGPTDADYTTAGWTTSDCPWNLTCPVDTYYNSESKKCVRCDTHNKVIAKQNSEYIINNETTIFSDGSITARCKCENNGYTLSEDGSCDPINNIECQPGKYLTAGRTACNTPCLEGFYCPGNATYTFSSSNDQGITKCPAGSTSAAGAESIDKCSMNSDTKFCDANGENCVLFEKIFGKITINSNL